MNMKCTNSSLSEQPKNMHGYSEQSKKASALNYDSYRNDSGYNSCSCHSISSTLSDSNLSLRGHESSSSEGTLQDSRTTGVSMVDSGLSLDCACENSSSNLNDLNKQDKVQVCSTGGDSGLGLEIDDKFSKLSVSEKRLNTNILEDNLDLNTLGNAPKTIENYPHPHDLLNLDPSTHLKLVQDAYLPDKDGDTHLHLAVVRGRLDIILALIYLAPHPAYLDLQNNLYQTALHLAVLTGQSKVVRRLVLAGASLDVRNRMGNTPLHLACGRGDLDCVLELTRPISVIEVQVMKRIFPHYRPPRLSIPQNLEIRNYEGQMCVHLAAIAQYKDILWHLKLYGANINGQEGKGGRTPLCYAIEARNFGLVEFLIKECQADINATTYAGISPFQMACGLDSDLAEQLVKLGASQVYPNSSDSESDSDFSLDETMDTSEEYTNYSDFKINGEPLW